MVKKLQNQSGVSLIAAIFIIVILAFMGMVFLTLFTSTSSTSINELQSTQALYVAEGGLERGIGYLLSPSLTERVACASIPATNTSLGLGQFSLSIEAGSPFYLTNAPTLSAPILAATPSPIDYIQISSSNGLAVFGRVMIDRELFDYTSISSIAAECGGSQPCLRGVIRARDGATAAQHVSGTRVGQYQCTVTSTGGIYDLATPNARRQVSEGIQLQEGWAVGDRDGNNLTFIRWNRDIEVQWNDASFDVGAARADLNGVSMLSYSDGWAVGDERNGFTIRRWNPDGTPSWDVSPGIPIPANDYIKDLLGVSAVSTREAWAVGERSDDPAGSSERRYTILRWNGSTWCLLDPAGSCNGITIPADNNVNNQNLNAIHVIDTDGDGLGNFGFAVGNAYDNCSGNDTLHTILRWNGATWVLSAVPACSENNKDLRGVFTVSANEAWAVGERYNCGGMMGGGRRHTIMQLSGGNWQLLTPPTIPDCSNDNTHLYSIYMLDLDGDGDADDGWAVGDTTGGRPTILRWNYNCAGTAQNNQWNNCTASAPATGQRLNSVFCVNASDCWAVGDGGTIVHWDGSAWTAHSQSGVVTGLNLNSVYVIGPKQRPQAMWREVFQ